MTSVPTILSRPPNPTHPISAKLTFTGRCASLAESTTPQTQNYLFINENLNLDTVPKDKIGASQSRSALYSHVQRFRRCQNLHTLPGTSCAASSTSTRKFLPYRRHSQRSKPEAASWFIDGESSTLTCTSPGASWDTHASNVAVENGAVECTVPALYSNNFLPGDACDPFNSTAVRVNQLNHNLMQFFLKVGWKAHLKTFGHTNTSQWSQSFQNLPDITRGSLSDGMHMDAFLTLNATRMSFYKLATFDRANSPDALMVKSLRGLRLSLPGLSMAGGGERVILDIFFLAFSEFYRQNYGVMRMHLKMIRRLVPSLGGFSSLCQYVREACCYTELCFAIETGQRPVFDLTWDPGPLHNLSWQRLKATLHSSKEKVLGTGFADALNDGFFDISMTTIIEELLVDLQAFEFIRNQRDPLPSDIEWACTRNRAYLHKLLSLSRPDEHSSMQQCRTYCVATTLLLVFCYECTYVSAVRSGQLVLARLEHFLRLTLGDFNQMEYNWGRQNDMLLWITVIGACVAEGGTREKWFLARAVHGCRALNMNSHTGLYDLMSRFMGLGDFQDRGLKNFVGHLENLDLSRIGGIEEISAGSALKEAALAFSRDT
jgi:hypothetical protein